IQAGHHLLAQGQEAGPFARCDGVRCWQLDAERIDMATADLEFIVQVRPGSQAGGADITDNLALGDVAPGPDAAGITAHVSVERLVGLTVLDHYGIAVSTLTPHVNDTPVAGRLDGGARGSGVIHTLVRTDLVQYRVAPAGVEAGADPGKLYRRADEGLAHAGAIGAVIAAVTLAVGVAHRGIGAAPVGEAGSKDIAGAHALIIDVFFLIQHIEPVALADLPGKVHVIAENVGHLHGQVMRQASILGGDEQRAGDAAAGETGADFGLDDVLAEYKAVAVAFDM